MSKLAAEYLGLLFGGQIDSDGRRRVQVSAGRITSYLRDEWAQCHTRGRRSRRKKPPDHRHHAVDAIVIALSDAATVETLSRSAHWPKARASALRSGGNRKAVANVR